MRGLAEERREMELKVRAAAAILKPRGKLKEWEGGDRRNKTDCHL